jgi:hypothetical protein
MKNPKFLLVALLFASSVAMGQMTGDVDKKTKEFYMVSNPKAAYRIFGYQYPNILSRKMICFSSYTYDVRDNLNKCPLGSYFDTGYMKEGDKITYLGTEGSFGKMIYTTGAGKKAIFYMPKTNFIFK